MPELIPCPFCGSTTAPTIMNQYEAQWIDNDMNAEDQSMVVCCAAKKFGCGASTGFCDTAEQAVEAWNRRASDWIPCSERLPDADGNYIVMRANAVEILEYSVEMELFGFTEEYKDEIGYNITEWYTVGGVSDWMPIPPKEGGDP